MSVRFLAPMLLGSAAALGFATPASAQHAGHAAPTSAPAPAPATCLPEHAAMGHCTLPAAPKAPATPAATTCAPEHAAMGHCTPAPTASAPPPPPTSDPSCPPEHAAMGHCTPAPTASAPPPPPTSDPSCPPEHAAMGHCTPAAAPASTRAAGTDLAAGDSPPPPAPSDHAADAVYGTQAMAMGRHHLVHYHGGQTFSQVMLNIAEVQWRKGRQAYEWDGEAWSGGDIGRLVVKSEGEGEFGGALEKAEGQALYSHAIGPYWNLQGGLRADVRPDPARVYATLGVEGLAPSFFDVEAALFLSNKGELMARLEGYADQRITQRLILQPRAELNLAAQDSPALRVGAGLSDAEVGLRLRYDLRREFAPYIGVQVRRAFGQTRRYLRAQGEEASGWSLLTGIRMWF